MTLERIPGILDQLGRDLCLLVGGSVFARSPDLEANSKAFVSSTGRGGRIVTPTNGTKAAPSEEQMERIRKLKLMKYPPISGNHGKFFEFKKGFSGR